MGTYTPNLDLYEPSVNETGWGLLVAGNFTKIDNLFPDGLLAITSIDATGTPSSSTFLRGDGVWAAFSGIPGGSVGSIQFNNSGAFGGITNGSAGQVLASTGAGAQWITTSTAFQFLIDGGGTVPTLGAKGQIYLPYSCTIVGWVLTADQAGNAQVDVLQGSYSSFPTISSIAGTDYPTLGTVSPVSLEQKAIDTVLTGWGSTALITGDLLQVNLLSATTVTRLNLTLLVTIP